MFQLLELIENEEDREFCRKLSEQFDSAMLPCGIWNFKEFC